MSLWNSWTYLLPINYFPSIFLLLTKESENRVKDNMYLWYFYSKKIFEVIYFLKTPIITNSVCKTVCAIINQILST